MFNFEVATLDDLMRSAAGLVSERGLEIQTHKGPCREVVASSFELKQPRARLSRTYSRGRLFSALGELCWYLSGSDETDVIARYAPAYKQLDEGGRIAGAYGPRFVAFDSRNQVRYVIDKLNQSPTSRQAVIQLFDHEDVGAGHKDVPCTCTLQYFVREGQLVAVTYMRSNDVYLGLPHDVFCFTMLQELIARTLDVGLGAYHHVVGSLHVYEKDAAAITEFMSEGLQTTTWLMPEMPSGDPWPHVDHLLTSERQLRDGRDAPAAGFSDVPYWADLERLLAVFFAPKGDTERLEALRRQLNDHYFDNFVLDRLDRSPASER